MSFFYIRRIKDGRAMTPKGVQSDAPHLYSTFGKANGRRKTLWNPDLYEVVEVELIEKPNTESIQQ